MRVVTGMTTGRWGDRMATESLTYGELGDRLGTSPEAARSLARRLRLPRKPGNDGKVRIIVDLAEIQYTPLAARSPRTQTTDINALNAQLSECRPSLRRLKWKRIVSKPVWQAPALISSVSATGVTRSWLRPWH